MGGRGMRGTPVAPSPGCRMHYDLPATARPPARITARPAPGQREAHDPEGCGVRRRGTRRRRSRRLRAGLVRPCSHRSEHGLTVDFRARHGWRRLRSAHLGNRPPPARPTAELPSALHNAAARPKARETTRPTGRACPEPLSGPTPATTRPLRAAVHGDSMNPKSLRQRCRPVGTKFHVCGPVPVL